MRLYRLLLRVLPRDRRQRYGDELLQVFREQRAVVRRIGTLRLWAREVMGMMRFAIRSRLEQARPGARLGGDRRGLGGGPGWLTELRWAQRGVRARGWRAAFVVGLLGLTLAANAVLFAVADSLVFRRSNLPRPERLVTIAGRLADSSERVDPPKRAAILAAWNRQPQVLEAASVYLQKTLFLAIGRTTEQVRTVDVTPEFFGVLGVKPRWGRAFTSTDAQLASGFTVIISEGLARDRFGRPSLAPGQTLQASAGPLYVVGVMSASFAFPDASYRIWRALDLSGPLARNHAGPVLARLARNVDRDRLLSDPGVSAELARSVGGSAGLVSYQAEFRPTELVGAGGSRRTTILVLVGVGACLLLASCANAASLELAHARLRARTNAVHLALGASRASLRRVLAVEGGLLIGGAVLAAGVLAWMGFAALELTLPDTWRVRTQNPINLDSRAVGFSVFLACVAWMLAMLPAVWWSHSSVLGLLKAEDRTSAGSRGTRRIRAALSVVQVAAAVALSIGGLLYFISYRALLSVEKGFDSSRLVELRYVLPVTLLPTRADKHGLVEAVTNALTSRRLIDRATWASAPPSTGDSPMAANVEVDGKAPLPSNVYIGAKWVDDRFFSVVRLPLKTGRYLSADDGPTNVVVGESFARQFWGPTDPVGRSFRLSPRHPWNVVVGVVGDVRLSPRPMSTAGDDRLFYYAQMPTPAPSADARPAAPVDTGGVWASVVMTLRLAEGVRPETALRAAREVDPQLSATIVRVDSIYADQNVDVRLAGMVVGVSSVLAFMVAIAGLYGLMHFLVSSRRREIGIRMALGADSSDVRRMVLGSSFRLAAGGAILGSSVAWYFGQWIESQLFGVTPADPATYALVIVCVLLATLGATWHPAHQAARTDPSVTLRAE